MAADDTTQVDRLSEGLIAEFNEHYRVLQSQQPKIDRRAVFEGWAIQKIAALQWAMLAMWRQSGSPDLRRWGSDEAWTVGDGQRGG